MNILFWSLLSTFIISLISLLGVIALSFKKGFLDKILLSMVGFSAGVLMGDAFIHLIPEGLEKAPAERFFLYLLIGFILFFLLERIVHWRHCHKMGGECDIHPFAYTNLIGDGLHNFIDGLIIAASFSLDWKLGLGTSLAVIIHEIPQEISDFGVLVYGGFSKKKAIFFNFLSGSLAVFGAIVGVFLANKTDKIETFLIALAAAGFLYIAAADLVPEIHKERHLKRSLTSFGFFIFGIIVMYLLKIFLE
jgi:zinc and cadmium transporter